jgi:hypothetical protein
MNTFNDLPLIIRLAAYVFSFTVLVGSIVSLVMLFASLIKLGRAYVAAQARIRQTRRKLEEIRRQGNGR